VEVGRSTVRFVAALLVLAAASVLPVASADAVTRPKTLYHERPVSAAPVESGFPIDHVGVTFEIPVGADVGHDGWGEERGRAVHVRFRKDGVWGAWIHVEEDGAQEIGRWTGALVAGGDADAYQVKGLPSFARAPRVAAINTTDGPSVVVGHRVRSAAAAVTPCKSRADWGADESIRTSDRSYAPLQVMTVHHTATQNNDSNPDARVRAIYTYHVRTNGWADIGYQALVSENGTVYEGSWSGGNSPSCLTRGGTTWKFGHETTAAASPIVTGAHTGGYNTGNFGVALLGTFTSVAPRNAARNALIAYLAELSKRHGVDPVARVRYDNGTNSKIVYSIAGHRDFTATDCPGGKLHADLPAIRTAVKART